MKMDIINSDPRGETKAGQVAHKIEKPKSTTHTHILPDGSLVTKTKRRKSFPDGSLFTKTRTETFSATAVTDAPTTHVIKTKTRRINSGGGLSFTTTTKEEMLENPPITHTKVLPDGSRIIKTKTVTAGPVTTTTIVHLTTAVSSGQKQLEEEHRDAMLELGSISDDEAPPAPPHYNDALYDYDEEERTKKLQPAILPEEIEDEEPIPPEMSEEPIENENKITKGPYRKIWPKRAVAPMPEFTDPNEVTQDERESIADESTQSSGYGEEGLAVATPVDEEEGGPIYEATEYTPEVKTPLYKQGRYIFWTVVALLVISVVVATTAVFATKEAVEEDQTPPQVSEREALGIQSYIQANVLQRNANWDGIAKDDPRHMALEWLLHGDKMQLESLDERLSQRTFLPWWHFPLILEDGHSVAIIQHQVIQGKNILLFHARCHMRLGRRRKAQCGYQSCLSVIGTE